MFCSSINCCRLPDILDVELEKIIPRLFDCCHQLDNFNYIIVSELMNQETSELKVHFNFRGSSYHFFFFTTVHHSFKIDLHIALFSIECNATEDS